MNRSLSLGAKVSYGFSAVGKDMVYILSASYVLYYFQDVLGVNAWAMGVILLCARIFDAFNDPIMGVITAKTKTRWGKFRPWLFIGTLLNTIVTYMTFSAPKALTGGGLVAYAAVTYVLWGMTYTMADIPFWSMVPSLTEPGKEREQLTQIGRTCATIGGAIVTVASMVCVMKLGGGDEREGFKWYALIISVFTFIAMMATCLTIKEKSTVDMETVSIKQMFKSLFRNDQALTVALTIILINTAFYITANLAIYFYKYDVGGANWYQNYTWFAIVGGASQAVSMIALFPILRKFMRATTVFKTALFMAAIGYVLFSLIVFFNLHHYCLFVPAVVIFSANGLLLVLLTLFLADTVDYGEYKNGNREESVVFSIQTLVSKFASGISALIASACIAIFHISKDTTHGAAAVALEGASKNGLRVTITILPMLIFVAAIAVFLKKYKLTEEKMHEISNALYLRKEIIEDRSGE